MIKFKTYCGIDLITCKSSVELVTNEKFNQYLDDYQFDNEKEIDGIFIFDLVQNKWIINMDILSIKWKEIINENKEK